MSKQVFTCGNCVGTGELSNGSECPACDGSGVIYEDEL